MVGHNLLSWVSSPSSRRTSTPGHRNVTPNVASSETTSHLVGRGHESQRRYKSRSILSFGTAFPNAPSWPLLFHAHRLALCARPFSKARRNPIAFYPLFAQ